LGKYFPFLLFIVVYFCRVFIFCPSSDIIPSCFLYEVRVLIVKWNVCMWMCLAVNVCMYKCVWPHVMMWVCEFVCVCVCEFVSDRQSANVCFLSPWDQLIFSVEQLIYVLCVCCSVCLSAATMNVRIVSYNKSYSIQQYFHIKDIIRWLQSFGYLYILLVSISL